MVASALEHSEVVRRNDNNVAAEVEGVFLRRVHSHEMVGVDLALTPFPQMARQAARVQRELNTAVAAPAAASATRRPRRQQRR